MKSKHKNQTPSFHDLWVVSQAAGNLTSQACTISARHLQDGVTRSIFNREVAYYARSIVSDVEQGKKTVAEGLIEIKNEQRSLLNQSMEIGQKRNRRCRWRTSNGHGGWNLLRIRWHALPYRGGAADGAWRKQHI